MQSPWPLRRQPGVAYTPGKECSTAVVGCSWPRFIWRSPLAPGSVTAHPPTQRSARGRYAPMGLPVVDTRNRPLHDLRISITDRCNFRCTYCMPREIFGAGFVFLPSSQLLTFEEITRLARIFVGLGVE